MGRGILILVLLMSTLFTAIAIRVQRDMAKLPDTLLEEQLRAEAENVSDYALRYAVLYAKNNIFEKNAWKIWEELINLYPELSIKIVFNGHTGTSQNGNDWYIYSPPFVVNNPQLGSTVSVDTLAFNRLSGNSKDMRFRVRSSVSGSLQDANINHFPAEIAFSYNLLNKPDRFYYESEVPNYGGQKPKVPDTSGNNNLGYATVALKTSPANLAWKSIYFPGPGGNDSNSNGAFYVPDNPGNSSMRVSDQFTLVFFLQGDKFLMNHDAAVIWFPSSDHPDPNLPSIGIWYDNESQNMMFDLGILGTNSLFQIPYHYVGNNELFPGPYMETDALNPGQNKFPISFFALTFGPRANESYARVYFRSFFVDNKGVFEKMVEQTYTDYESTATQGFEGAVKVMETAFGVSIGARVTEIIGDYIGGFHECKYDMYFQGLMDNLGMFGRELTESEIDDFFWNVVLNDTVTYLRD